MLENMRRQGASIFIYAIFGLLIAIFVVNIGPGSRNEGGCSGTSNTIMTVDGESVSQTAYHIAFGVQSFLNYEKPPTGKEKTYYALEALIARELLADEAESRGMRITDDVINNQITNGSFFYSGLRLHPSEMYEVIGGEKYYTRLKQWIASLNVSPTSYRDEQKRSMLATMMAQILEESVGVSRDEALQEFLYEGNTVSYDLVPFRIQDYRAALEPTDADFARFTAEHAADLQARYKADERTYKGVKPQLELREIFIAKAEPPKAEPPKPEPPKPDDKAAGSAAGSAATPAPAQGSAAATSDKKADDKTANADDKTADKKADDKTAKADEKKEDKKSVGMPTEEAKAKLEAARTAIAGGKQKFADAARQLATDEALRSTGGRVGWRTADAAGFDEPAVNDAIKTLKPGEMTPVITTERGAYLVIAENKREGDLSFDQVKEEIGREMALDVWSKEAAKRAALAALDKARTSGKPLHEIFTPAPRDPFEGLTPRQRRQMMEQMLQGGVPSSGEQGSVTVESKDIPASWTGDSDVAPTGGGSATGSAATGTATATAPTGAAATDATADLMTPSKDQLPAMGEVPEVKVESHKSAMLPDMPGYGRSKELTDALFTQLKPGELAQRIFQAEGSFNVVQLIDRGQPKLEEFDKIADQRLAELRLQRGRTFLRTWLKDRCEKLAKEGKITPNQGLLVDHDDQGNPLPITYRPCMTF